MDASSFEQKAYEFVLVDAGDSFEGMSPDAGAFAEHFKMGQVRRDRNPVSYFIYIENV